MATSGTCIKFSRFLLQASRGQLPKQPVRHRWVFRHRGKPPDLARSLTDRLKELKEKDPELDKDINIGFPVQKTSVSRKNHKNWIKLRQEKEQITRLGKLSIPLEDVQQQYETGMGLQDTHDVAKHYGIFRDLFDNAFFIPNTNVEMFYEYDDDYVSPVYRGNIIDPAEVSKPPIVHYDSDPDSLWTFILSNPDGHLQDNTKEVLHWFVGNIPGSEVDKGEIICDYLPPFPPKGTGFHRYIFILYKQDHVMDFSSEQCSKNSMSLEERTFQTLEFYRRHQDELTPSGLAFFQAEWDESVTDTFRNTLDMPEPVFEFFHPPVYHPKQLMFPKAVPFNLYLDRYRDIKDIREEVLREKLKMISPFSEHSQGPKYPNIYKIPLTYPQWLRTKIQRMRLRKNQWRDLP